MRRAFSVVVARSLLVLLALAAIATLPPAEAFGQPGAAQEQARERLRETVRGRFRVLSVTGGLVLVPRSGAGGVESVELRNGTVAINGTEVTGAELRSRLGRDADAVIELSYLDPEERQRLLLDGRVEAPERRSPSVLPPVPQPQRRRLPEAAERLPDRDFRRHSEGRVRVGGDVRVEEDEEVDGPVVAIFGSVHVNGRVRDAVVAVGGGVSLGPRAEVRGDVTSVGGG
ncbi:MAG TPA: polymer-forming cytoskeletal protein, partial [Vicinamibacterales bacterium]|nr:polymer-forming cytoskeletal protein [Vicinamibacterales bacterium]